MLRLALGLLRAKPSLLAGPAAVLLMAVSVITMFGSLVATAIDGHAGSRLGVIGGRSARSPC